MPSEQYIESLDTYYVAHHDLQAQSMVKEKLDSFALLENQKQVIILQFFEKKKKNWFQKEEECWEEWNLTFNITRAKTEKEQIEAKTKTIVDLEKSLMYISVECGKHIDHVPPIVNSDPFPFTIAENQIPAGKFSTYGQIASVLKTSPLAVGQALKRNPHSTVPCHRVITSKYAAHGFFGSMNNERKIKKLTDEGLKFEGEILAEECRNRLVTFAI
ncbi:hypothetical protein HDV01_006013 [Terramyces sp. JEL0728]|nr:hypothetical protein HDV01_006013 [Terramyces sp. JEL0728]